MPKRALAAVLWFIAIWVGYEIVWSLTDVPRLIGPVVAAAVSGFVTVDPLRLFWPVPSAGRTSSHNLGATQVPS